MTTLLRQSIKLCQRRRVGRCFATDFQGKPCIQGTVDSEPLPWSIAAKAISLPEPCYHTMGDAGNDAIQLNNDATAKGEDDFVTALSHRSHRVRSDNFRRPRTTLYPLCSGACPHRTRSQHPRQSSIKTSTNQVLLRRRRSFDRCQRLSERQIQTKLRTDCTACRCLVRSGPRSTLRTLECRIFRPMTNR